MRDTKKITKNEMVEALNDHNVTAKCEWSGKVIEDVATAGAKCGFVAAEMTCRRLRDDYGLKGSNNLLVPVCLWDHHKHCPTDHSPCHSVIQ